jgi:hypothetical protein
VVAISPVAPDDEPACCEADARPAGDEVEADRGPHTEGWRSPYFSIR